MPKRKTRREFPKRQFIGMVFGKLTVTGLVEREYHTSINGKSRFRYYVMTLCACGNIKRVETNKLQMGYTKSCGCIVDTNGLPYLTKTHGLSGTREYNIWAGIKSRCYDTNCSAYTEYGAKGVIMSERWINSFENFLSDMGMAPTPKHSVDRFPNKTGNYDPSNCRWATMKEQQNNRTDNVNITLDGITKTMSEWAEVVGIDNRTIHARIKSGWGYENAIKTKLYGNGKNGKKKSSKNVNIGV